MRMTGVFVVLSPRVTRFFPSLFFCLLISVEETVPISPLDPEVVGMRVQEREMCTGMCCKKRKSKARGNEGRETREEQVEREVLTRTGESSIWYSSLYGLPFFFALVLWPGFLFCTHILAPSLLCTTRSCTAAAAAVVYRLSPSRGERTAACVRGESERQSELEGRQNAEDVTFIPSRRPPPSLFTQQTQIDPGNLIASQRVKR